MKFEKIEKDLTNLLLRDIVIYINPAKPLKQGKLVLFKVKDFYFSLSLENEKGDLKQYEIQKLSCGHEYCGDCILESFKKIVQNIKFKNGARGRI